jgi:hypothetical protein
MLVVLTFSVVHPLQLMMIPLAMLLVALPPRRVPLLLFAGLLVLLSFTGPRTTMWSLERGWALLLGGYFVGAAVLWPDRSFLVRGLAATAATMGTAAVVLALTGSWTQLDWTMAAHYREVAESVGRSWPGGLVDADAVVELSARLPARLFPAFVAVGSMAALAVSWWGYGRLAKRGDPLSRLTEFRFPDPLVWLLILGIALLVAPQADWGIRIGSNLVFFMSALYALRGLAVLAALVLGMVGPQLPVLLVLGVVALLLYPIVVAGTLLLGVTDTWLDLRSGRRTANGEG